ncbi:MAG TPA: DUF6702 family protein [Flavisolibacter sp.]|nr:DUF6702 family protein [Flavisolibacter sp.]
MMFILSKWLLLLMPFGFLKAERPVAEKGPHPFYVSVTEINHNAAEKSLEISCKFFLDDFEHVLEKTNKVQLDILSDKEKAAFDKYIPLYISNHLSFVIDGKPVKLNYLGYEREKESVYCYFEVTNVSLVKQLNITSNLLYDLTPEQINIMHVTVGGKRQSARLAHPETNTVVKF